MKTKSLLSLTVIALGLSGSALAQTDQWGYRTLDLDVATDAPTLAVTGLEDGQSESGEAIETHVRGSTFLINGKFFAKGTISKGDYGFDPDTAPNLLGNWISMGVYNVNVDEMDGDVPHATSTTQLVFSAKGDQAAANSLTVVGQEGGMITWRPITGGTGKYRGAVGQMSQKFLGKNSTGGANFRVRFRIKGDIGSLEVHESVDELTNIPSRRFDSWASDNASGVMIVGGVSDIPNVESGVGFGDDRLINIEGLRVVTWTNANTWNHSLKPKPLVAPQGSTSSGTGTESIEAPGTVATTSNFVSLNVDDEQ